MKNETKKIFYVRIYCELFQNKIMATLVKNYDNLYTVSLSQPLDSR